MSVALKVGQPRFLDVDDAELVNVLTVETHGGMQGVRDGGLLESALAQARAGASGQYLHEFPFGMAAAYAFHLARNHPFILETSGPRSRSPRVFSIYTVGGS